MKKLLSSKLLLATVFAAALALCMVACSGGSGTANSDAESTDTAATEEAATEETTEEGTAPAAPENPVIRVSTTTSVNDSGLLPYLQPYFEEDTGYQLEVTSAGTGAAIKKGETGDADVLLVHAKASEEEFVEAGFGVERVSFMYNYFVIVGPADDPAGVADCATAADAFAAIADSQSAFVSRGDDSGTNKKELQIWEAAGINPDGQEWYINAGSGMGATLTQANERQAYTLSDKGTFLSNDASESLQILLGESDDMKNTYTMIAISPEAWPDTNIDGANAFIEWMTSDKALQLIAEYGTEEYGEPLFYILES
ncbi:PBP superfamily domain [Slackia heliotrinireducens]|uniref:ABC-type tungstate transport system, permease component n=1 Tax=Slackia heliotrinireducens (strain ATCC 29202 / DSM 20476 / NCTC 11029 / RHS 1) TaxID=471855 RepID=C7N3I9_SLAHD|nr:substrate-binding domain-containing protein [Slackia heliotrinireducens]ACV23712.1 ABC-type tungstate transport system, permease component [Slackia heliotrinireducens DSM 20476]VEH03291.1 PBP superfamily domain [Slackia heliotrinireducens]